MCRVNKLGEGGVALLRKGYNSVLKVKSPVLFESEYFGHENTGHSDL